MQTYLTSRLLGFTVASLVAVLAPAGAFGLTDRPLSAAQPNANGAGSIIEKIVFASTRDNPTGTPQLAAEIYLMNPDGTHPVRLTENSDGDALPNLSPEGRGKIVFDSNRNRAEEEPLNTSDLFLMNADGTEQTLLTRGSSASWSPDGKNIVFHASASGTGKPIKADPGAATEDSDIFAVNVDDLLEGVEAPRNITNDATAVDDDPDWSPDAQRIAFTSHPVTDNPNNSTKAEIYLRNADGTGDRMPLTSNTEEERAPAWSPEGTQILFMCRRGLPPPGALLPTFEICVMNADGTNQVQLTSNFVPDLTPSWSPDGQKIVFHRPVAGRFQLWLMNADGTGQMQLTNTPGLNLFANWSQLESHGAGAEK